MASLPKSFNLFEPIPSLPDGAQSQLITCRPVSGSSFSPQSIIEVDLGNRGWCDPQSISIRYKVVAVADATSSSAIIATPVFTPFQRVSTLIGGASIDNISNYNQCAHVLTQLQLSAASKYGLQFMYGFTANQGSMAAMDARITANNTTDTFTVAAPLIGTLLSCSEKQLPLFAMPQVRFQFTLDSLANMSFVQAGANGYNTYSSITLSNFELCYTMIDMGAGVEKMVYDNAGPILIKTHGLNNSAVAIGAGSVGSNSYVFNQRFASIRSAFVLPNLTIGSKWAEFVDCTQGNGDYQLLIGNQAFPQAPLSSALNKAGILAETRRAAGNLYTNNEFSINSVEFNTYTGNTAIANLSVTEPGKLILGVNLDKVSSADHVMMSGTSTYNTPISVNINIGATAVTNAMNLNLLLDYDAILVLDPKARQLSVRS
jgi:hypothetical protein